MRRILTAILSLVILMTSMATAEVLDAKQMRFIPSLGFDGGLAPIKMDGKFGFVDTQGNIIIQPEWENYQPSRLYNSYKVYGTFADGYVLVEKDGKQYFIDKQGDIAIESDWDNVGMFTCGLAWVKKDGKIGYINTDGELVIDTIWNSGTYFMENKAVVRDENGISRVIDTKGNVLAEYNRQSMSIGGFSEGLAVANIDELYGFVGVDGDWEIAPPTSTIGDERNYRAYSFSEGRARIYYPTSRTYGFIDTKGNIVIDPVWRNAERFSNGLALVSTIIDGEEMFGFINSSGDIVIDFEWTFARGFSEGLAYVKNGNDGRCGFIDTKGNIAIDLVEIFGEVSPNGVSHYMTEGHILVNSKDQLYILNSEGEIVF